MGQDDAVRIVVAPGRFAGSLTAGEAAVALAEGWARTAPSDDIVVAPLGDGGPGFVADLHTARGGELTPVVLREPGSPGGSAPAALLRLPDGTVVVEAAHVLGRRLGSDAAGGAGLEGAMAGPSTAAADLLRAALAAGPDRVVLGLGGLACHDAGAGLLHALGAGTARLGAGGAALAGLVGADVRGAAGLENWPCEVVVAADVEVPLLGLHGASALLAVPEVAGGPALAADDAQGLERGIAHLVHLLGADLGPGRVRAAATARGAGAGGGLAFALALLGAQVRDGADVAAELSGLDGAVAGADLVLTGVGLLDPHALHGTGLAAAARAGLVFGVPVVALAEQVLLGRREASAAGLSGAYPVVESLDAQDAARQDPAGSLRTLAARVARTWSH